MARLFKRGGEKKKGLWRRVVDLALTDVRVAVGGVDHESLESLEERLLAADFGVDATLRLVDHVDLLARRGEVSGGSELRRALTDEIARILEPARSSYLQVADTGMTVYLIVGVNGVGKTTSVAKLARFLQEREKKKVMVVSCDVYRPAAIEQLRIVAGQVGVECFPSSVGEKPADIALAALAEAKRQYFDVLVIDTAGRTTVDAEMMAEIADLHGRVSPTETLFVVDSMTGQDAANTAKAFAEAVPLSGVVLTKVDGDARGGAALSVRQVTGRPIKFLGIGEKSDKLEVFHPDRIANRILGQGDVLSLIEETSRKVDQEKAAKLAEKLKKNKRFDLADFREQMEQMQNLGSVESLLEKLPGGAQMQAQLKNVDTGRQVRRTIAIINSMTPQERRFPDLIKASRKRRIAAGAGVEVQQVNQLLRQFDTTRDMMKKVAGGGLSKMMRGLAGRLPPGMVPRR